MLQRASCDDFILMYEFRELSELLKAAVALFCVAGLLVDD